MACCSCRVCKVVVIVVIVVIVVHYGVLDVLDDGDHEIIATHGIHVVDLKEGRNGAQVHLVDVRHGLDRGVHKKYCLFLLFVKNSFVFDVTALCL